MDSEPVGHSPADPRDRNEAIMRGLPQTDHGAWGPVGKIEQAAKVADGWRQRRTGWRLLVFRGFLLFVALFVGGMLLLAYIASGT